jgi:hypothetical protein
MRRIALLPLLALLLAGCPPKAPLAPPQYGDPQRAPTGDTSVEYRVALGVELEELTDAQYATLREAGLGVAPEPALLQRYALAGVARGEIQEVADVLMKRALAASADEAKTADMLGLVMAHYRWDLCADLATRVLESTMSSGGFLLRALCLERDARPEEADLNITAAAKLMPFPADIEESIRSWLKKRNAAGEMPPSRRDDFENLLQAMSRRGNLDRLFVQQLMGHYEGSLEVGTFTAGGISETDIKLIIGSRSRSYRYCHELQQFEQRKAGALSGKARVRFQADSLGRVGNVEWIESEWGGHPGQAGLEACLADQLQRLRMPPPRFGRPRLIVHSFSFVAD